MIVIVVHYFQWFWKLLDKEVSGFKIIEMKIIMYNNTMIIIKPRVIKLLCYITPWYNNQGVRMKWYNFGTQLTIYSWTWSVNGADHGNSSCISYCTLTMDFNDDQCGVTNSLLWATVVWKFLLTNHKMITLLASTLCFYTLWWGLCVRLLV